MKLHCGGSYPVESGVSRRFAPAWTPPLNGRPGGLRRSARRSWTASPQKYVLSRSERRLCDDDPAKLPVRRDEFGGPREFLSWEIESTVADFAPKTCMEWLEGRLPRLLDDLSQWRNEYEDEDAESGPRD